jgi:hypothetical protein
LLVSRRVFCEEIKMFLSPALAHRKNIVKHVLCEEIETMSRLAEKCLRRGRRLEARALQRDWNKLELMRLWCVTRWSRGTCSAKRLKHGVCKPVQNTPRCTSRGTCSAKRLKRVKLIARVFNARYVSTRMLCEEIETCTLRANSSWRVDVSRRVLCKEIETSLVVRGVWWIQIGLEARALRRDWNMWWPCSLSG